MVLVIVGEASRRDILLYNNRAGTALLQKTTLQFQGWRVYPKSLEMQLGDKGAKPHELSLLSDWVSGKQGRSACSREVEERISDRVRESSHRFFVPDKT